MPAAVSVVVRRKPLLSSCVSVTVPLSESPAPRTCRDCCSKAWFADPTKPAGLATPLTAGEVGVHTKGPQEKSVIIPLPVSRTRSLHRIRFNDFLELISRLPLPANLDIFFHIDVPQHLPATWTLTGVISFRLAIFSHIQMVRSHHSGIRSSWKHYSPELVSVTVL
ncbi:hypothetical protein N657DRAFT_47645 [Parathielavia appendiculata]|uniref:Uncharacterized protein n=1 Tax=Parathielavia appendiculata TaxID=2587402 RepID=A0AAN6Z8W7_9PEZI|nr:hypothetical protein N657DRAFT_47645 [Parathielavia appendiculata]